MFTLVLTIHFILCVVLVVLVLLQQGKGADVGAVFSGGSNTLFGASGANTLLTRITTGTAILFMCTSIALVRLYQGRGLGAGPAATTGTSVLDTLPAAPVTEENAPAEAGPKAAAPAGASSQGAAAVVPAPEQAPQASSEAASASSEASAAPAH